MWSVKTGIRISINLNGGKCTYSFWKKNPLLIGILKILFYLVCISRWYKSLHVIVSRCHRHRAILQLPNFCAASSGALYLCLFLWKIKIFKFDISVSALCFKILNLHENVGAPYLGIINYWDLTNDPFWGTFGLRHQQGYTYPHFSYIPICRKF